MVRYWCWKFRQTINGQTFRINFIKSNFLTWEYLLIRTFISMWKLSTATDFILFPTVATHHYFLFFHVLAKVPILQTGDWYTKYIFCTIINVVGSVLRYMFLCWSDFIKQKTKVIFLMFYNFNSELLEVNY